MMYKIVGYVYDHQKSMKDNFSVLFEATFHEAMTIRKRNRGKAMDVKNNYFDSERYTGGPETETEVNRGKMNISQKQLEMSDGFTKPLTVQVLRDALQDIPGETIVMVENKNSNYDIAYYVLWESFIEITRFVDPYSGKYMAVDHKQDDNKAVIIG